MIINVYWYLNLMFIGPCIIVITEEWKPTRCHLLFYCTSCRLNMFRALLCPSSGARDYNVDYHNGRFVLGLMYVGCGYAGVVSGLQAKARFFSLLVFLSDFRGTWILSTHFRETMKHHILRNSVHWEPSSLRTDRRTERNDANNSCFSQFCERT